MILRVLSKNSPSCIIRVRITAVREELHVESEVHCVGLKLAESASDLHPHQCERKHIP